MAPKINEVIIHGHLRAPCQIRPGMQRVLMGRLSYLLACLACLPACLPCCLLALGWHGIAWNGLGAPMLAFWLNVYWSLEGGIKKEGEEEKEREKNSGRRIGL